MEGAAGFPRVPCASELNIAPHYLHHIGRVFNARHAFLCNSGHEVEKSGSRQGVQMLLETGVRGIDVSAVL